MKHLNLKKVHCKTNILTKISQISDDKDTLGQIKIYIYFYEIFSRMPIYYI